MKIKLGAAVAALVVGLAVWVTKNPNCLWALILVAWVAEGENRGGS